MDNTNRNRILPRSFYQQDGLQLARTLLGKVLLRALEPVVGLDWMEQRRHTHRTANLCSGPGKLCQAMAIDRSCYGMDLLGEELWLEDASAVPEGQVAVSKRIHIDYAGEAADWPYRFCVADCPYLSAPAEN